jgi:hypothetical protein
MTLMPVGLNGLDSIVIIGGNLKSIGYGHDAPVKHCDALTICDIKDPETICLGLRLFRRELPLLACLVVIAMLLKALLLAPCWLASHSCDTIIGD